MHAACACRRWMAPRRRPRTARGTLDPRPLPAYRRLPGKLLAVVTPHPNNTGTGTGTKPGPDRSLSHPCWPLQHPPNPYLSSGLSPAGRRLLETRPVARVKEGDGGEMRWGAGRCGPQHRHRVHGVDGWGTGGSNTARTAACTRSVRITGWMGGSRAGCRVHVGVTLCPVMIMMLMTM